VDRRVVAAYRRAEQARVKQLDSVLTARAIPYTRIAGSSEIRARLVDMTEMFSRAG